MPPEAKTAVASHPWGNGALDPVEEEEPTPAPPPAAAAATRAKVEEDEEDEVWGERCLLALDAPLAPAPVAEGSMYSAVSASRMYESPSSNSPSPQPLLGTLPRPERRTLPSSSAAAVTPARGLVSLRTPPRAPPPPLPDPGPGLGREREEALRTWDEDEGEAEAAPPGKCERNGLSAIPHRS